MKKKKVIYLRLNEEEFNKVETLFKKSCFKSMNKFAIRAILDAKITSKEVHDEMLNLNMEMSETNRQLRGACANLNQIAKIANSTNQINLEEINSVNEELKKHVKELMKTWRLIRSSLVMQAQGEQ